MGWIIIIILEAVYLLSILIFLLIKKLEGKDDFESQKKIMKIKDELKRAQLGVITNISLPPIK